jgi:hypothetical protein
MADLKTVAAEEDVISSLQIHEIDLRFRCGVHIGIGDSAAADNPGFEILNRDHFCHLYFLDNAGSA